MEDVESIGDIIQRLKLNNRPKSQAPEREYNLEDIKKIYLEKYKLEVETRAKTLKEMPKDIDLICMYIKNMLTYKAEVSKNNPWLWLTGYVGNGKTTSAKSLQKTFRELSNEKKVFKMYEAVEIANLYELKDHFNYNSLQKCPFLIIDDMGVEINLNKKQYAVAEVLYYRYKFMLPTVITTNLTREQIKSIYDERIFDRMEELSTKIVFANQSYRR